MEKLKEWLQQQRRDTGLTHAAFAKQLGVSRVTLQRFLAGGSVTDKRKRDIEEATNGAVPVISWYPDLEAAE
jgi:transcriptional regulator with XRE-family HTH domain